MNTVLSILIKMSIDDKINLHYEAIRKLQERQTIIN